MKKQSFIAAIMLAFGVGQVSAKQVGEVPDAVVEKCMAKNNASELPDCLKEGAYGHYMLQQVLTADLYGEKAAPVVEACRSLNDTLQGAWICFSVAAEKAVETRALVGQAKITDQCVVDISDPEAFARLQGIASDQRRLWFPDEMFSGGTMYHSFKGCMS